MPGKRKAVYIVDHWKINGWNLPQKSQMLMVQMMFIFPLSIFFSDVWVVCREFLAMVFFKAGCFFLVFEELKKLKKTY